MQIDNGAGKTFRAYFNWLHLEINHEILISFFFCLKVLEFSHNYFKVESFLTIQPPASEKAAELISSSETQAFILFFNCRLLLITVEFILITVEFITALSLDQKDLHCSTIAIL